MLLSGQDFPLERLQQQPDIRHPLELARALDGGIPISPAVIVGEGEMVYHQMFRPDGLFDEVTALPKSHPREVQKGQINGAVADEIPQLRVRHGAVSGDQDPETVIFQDTAVVGDLPVLCTLVSQAHEVHVQPLQGEMAAGTGQHQLEELVINVFILMIMLGCALATRDGSMITLSLIFDNVGVGGKKILTVIDTVVNLIFYAILIYTGFNKVFDQISTGKETFSLGWPEWVFTILLPIGSIFLVLHAIEYLVDVMSNKAACVKPAETEGGKETV